MRVGLLLLIASFICWILLRNSTGLLKSSMIRTYTAVEFLNNRPIPDVWEQPTGARRPPSSGTVHYVYAQHSLDQLFLWCHFSSVVYRLIRVACRRSTVSCVVSLDHTTHIIKSKQAIDVRAILGGHHARKKYFQSARKRTAMLTCKIALADSPHPIFVNKNPGFRAFHVAGRNEFRFFRFINIFFHFSLLAPARNI